MEEKDEGFTLILLLVVIIGILAAIAIPIFLNQRKKAVDASIKPGVKTVADVMETRAVENPSVAYPTEPCRSSRWEVLQRPPEAQ